MSGRLSPLDIAVVVAYVLGTTALGAWFTRRQRDLGTYFVGDRNVGWFLILVSIVATETSTVTFLSVPGLAFNPQGGNLTFLQLAFGYLIGRVAVAWFLLPQYLRGELFSAYQLLRERFNPTVQRTASGLFLVTRTVADGLRLFLTALLLQQFTGWNMFVSIVVMGVVTMTYTLLGGMQAVIWTDLIQFVIYILGALVAGWLLLEHLPGGLGEFLAVGSEAGKFTVLDFRPDPTRTLTFWSGVIGGAFFSMASHGADQLMVQRYLCSRSLGQARTALVLSGVVVLVQFLLFLLIGVGLYCLHRHTPLPWAPGGRTDEVFGAFIVRYLPTGLIGLVVAAVLAAAMSTLSSSLNSSANAFVSDFYRPLRGGGTEAHYLFVSRIMTLVWGLAQMGVAVVAVALQSQEAVVEQVLRVAGITTGLVLGLFVLGSLRRPVSSGAALVGLVVGLGVVLGVWLPEVWGQRLLAWPWYAPLGAGVTVAVALAVHGVWRGHGSAADGGPQPGLDRPG
ncbi:MAG: sodium/solute symporter [Gemmataceae bacterium]|nr:sodium/solute symporter [Gemmataceae bacterium]